MNRVRAALGLGLALGLPVLAVGTAVVTLEERHLAHMNRGVEETRVAIAARTLDESVLIARRGVRSLCAEDVSLGLALVSPSGDADVDLARARLTRIRAHGLTVGDVFARSPEGARGPLLASSHAHGRQPFVTPPDEEELTRGAVVELTSPHEGLPSHAVVTHCALGEVTIVGGVSLDLLGDPRFAGATLSGATLSGASASGESPADVSLSTDIPGARRILARPLETGTSGLSHGLVMGAGMALLLLGLVLGAKLASDGDRDEAGGDEAGRPSATPTDDEVEREVRAAAAKLSRGDFDVQLHAGADSTVAAFNQMTKELARARARAVKAERIAAWRDIARRIAHEIKNPLTPIRMAIETMRKTFSRQHPDFPEIFDESTRTVLEEVERMEKIVTEFSRFARLPRPNAALMNPLDVAVHVVSMHEVQNVAATNPDTPRAPRVKLEIDPSFQAPGKPRLVRADREQITQVLVNLVQNAIDAALSKRGEDGNVLVRMLPGEHGGAVIEVHDDGPGIPEPERARIFEPYYTTKAHGTGLGLPICDRIVSDHAGTLTVDDSPRLAGARMTVTLSREGPLDEADASHTA